MLCVQAKRFMKFSRKRRLLTVSSLLIFAVTLILNLASQIYSPKKVFDAFSGDPPKSTEALKQALSSPMTAFDLVMANNLVHESLRHNGTRKILFLENWLLWLGGKIYDPISRTQDPIRIANGGTAICSESAAVLNQVALINGLDARQVGIDGHVLSEVKVGEKWRLADPHYGFVLPVGYFELSDMDDDSMRAILMSAFTDRGIPEKTENYFDLFATRDNNWRKEIGEPESPRLALLENFANHLVWLISVFFGFTGILSLYWKSQP